MRALSRAGTVHRTTYRWDDLRTGSLMRGMMAHIIQVRGSAHSFTHVSTTTDTYRWDDGVVQGPCALPQQVSL